MTCLNSAKWLMTCSKLAKWLLCFLTCSKSAVLNKDIQGVFFKSQKSKNKLKRHRFIFTWEKQWQIKQSMTLFKSQKSKKKKKGYIEITDPYSLVT